MIFGYVMAFILLLVTGKYIVKRTKSKKLDKCFGNIHKPAAFIMLAVSIIHVIVTWKLREQRPMQLYVLGIVMICLIIGTSVIFLFRKKIGAKWIVVHRIAAAAIIICLAGHVFSGVYSLVQYKNIISEISISDVDLSTINDGEYAGAFDAGYIYAKVAVSVAGGKITNLELLEHRTERGKSAEAICRDIVERQSLDVDAISGATNSSYVIIKAVENALSK